MLIPLIVVLSIEQIVLEFLCLYICGQKFVNVTVMKANFLICKIEILYLYYYSKLFIVKNFLRLLSQYISFDLYIYFNTSL